MRKELKEIKNEKRLNERKIAINEVTIYKSSVKKKSSQGGLRSVNRKEAAPSPSVLK